MRIVVSVSHPFDVHFFKNFILEMQKRGHEILITASKKEVSIQLLDAYGFDYIYLGSYGYSLVKKLINVPIIALKMYKAVKSFKPDIFIGGDTVRSAHVSKMLRRPCIAITGTEHAMAEQLLYRPFTDAILTSTSFKKDFGKKQIRFNSYYELAYLHPNYFKPNKAVLDEIGLNKEDPFIILRFISWNAVHDIGHHGIKNKKEVVKELEKYGQVFITSEGELERDLEKYKIKVSPEKLHDLLYYASLYFGEGATVTSEAALLGTPAISISTLDFPGFLYDEARYGLVYLFTDPEMAEKEAICKAIELLKNNNLKKEAEKKKEKMLHDKIDVTAFMVWFVENYPESFKEMKENPEIQNQFK